MKRQLYRVCLIVLYSSLLMSCAGIKTSVIEEPDRNRTIYRLASLFAHVDRDIVGPHGNLAIGVDMYVPITSNDTSFYIKAMALSANKWVIASGDTMSVTIEDRDTYFLCSQPLVFGQDDGVTMQQTPYYFSGGWYQVNKSILYAMANASAVDIGIHTADGIITGRLMQSELDAIGEYQVKYFP